MVIGFGGILYNVTAISLIQAITPDRMLGRANASRRFVVWGVVPLGGFVGGALGLDDRAARDDRHRPVGGLLAIVPILALAAPLRRERCPSSSVDPQSLPDRLGEQRAGVAPPGEVEAAPAAAPARRSPPPTPPSRR